MSARNVPPTGEATPDPAADAERGRVRRFGVAGLASLATVTALAASFGLYALPDHDGIPKAAARTGRAVSARAARTAAHVPPDQRRPVQRKPPRAEVTITARARTIGVPRSFLGLSIEYWGLPLFERRMSAFARVLSLLHVTGGGPLVLRIGGDSADHSFWNPSRRTVPPWVFRLTPTLLRRTSVLVHRTGARLMLDLNLVTGSPRAAAQWARAAERGLPRGSLVGFEIGNEPDIYSRWYWLAAVSRTRLDASFLPSELSTRTYMRDFLSYAQAVSKVAPRVPLVGPALANPIVDMNWISTLLAGARPRLGIVSAHRYPYSACVDRSSARYPTIARLLSEQATAGMAQTVGPAAALAHRAGLPFRLTELNSVTCGGRPGVSDVFATALWAPDALFELLRAGVDGVNVHVRTDASNAAVTPTRTGLEAHPLLYGLILFARTLGADAQRVALQLHAERSLHLKVWAVRVLGGGLHVLLIDKSSQSVIVDLRLPATGPAKVERLLAPSASSHSGVTLDGQRLGRNGNWQGHPATETITPDIHGYELTIPGLSAALLSVRVKQERDGRQRK